MKKWISYGAFLVTLGVAVTLTVMAPDALSMAFGGVMTAIILLGGILGILPMVRFSAGFNHAIRNMRNAQTVQTTMPWLAIVRMDDFFNQREWYCRFPVRLQDWGSLVHSLV